jgi:hypothetical protein
METQLSGKTSETILLTKRPSWPPLANPFIHVGFHAREYNPSVERIWRSPSRGRDLGKRTPNPKLYWNQYLLVVL